MADETQRLTGECIEFLRHLHDHSARWHLPVVGADLVRSAMARCRTHSPMRTRKPGCSPDAHDRAPQHRCSLCWRITPPRAASRPRAAPSFAPSLDGGAQVTDLRTEPTDRGSGR
ncbi:MAG: hypothetical protein LC749_02065 [Actinobacteria bacterium]|nr:hypothetical protein [Actinomycetota bacterium]